MAKIGWFVLLSTAIMLMVLVQCSSGGKDKCKWESKLACDLNCLSLLYDYRCVKDYDSDKYCCRWRYQKRPGSCESKGDCDDRCKKTCYVDRDHKGYECYECNTLSTGAIIGIAVGVVAFVVIIVIIVVACFCCAVCPGYTTAHAHPVYAEPMVMAPPPPPPPPLVPMYM